MTSITVPRQLGDRLRDQAHKHGLTMTTLGRQMIEHCLDELAADEEKGNV